MLLLNGHSLAQRITAMTRVSDPSDGSTAGDQHLLDAAFLDMMPTMVWTAGPDQCVRYLNARWLTYRGRTLAEECTTGGLCGVHPDDSVQRRNLVAERYQLRCAWETEYRLARHDGTYCRVRESAAPWFSSAGLFCGYMGCCLNVESQRPETRISEDTDRVHSAAVQDVDAFMALASHDLQEPLRTVAAYTEMLGRRCSGIGDPQIRQSLDFLSASVCRMQRLIDGLLGYARTGRADLTRADVDLNSTVQLAVQACQAAIQESGAVVSHGALPKVRADEAQLAQVVQNLISNAVRYRRPDMPPRIHIGVLEYATEWLVSVSDNGTGFDPQYAEQIFSAFQRLHDRHCSGSGLGLAICRNIIERHGGRIWADAKPGAGAQFYFTLPRTYA